MLRDRGAPPGHRGLLVDLDGAAFVQYDSKSETNLAPISHDVVRWLHCTAQQVADDDAGDIAVHGVRTFGAQQRGAARAVARPRILPLRSHVHLRYLLGPL